MSSTDGFDGDGRSGRSPFGGRMPKMPGAGGSLRARRSPLATALLVVVGAIVLILLWSNIWTEKLWYDSVGYSSVFRTELLTKTAMFLGGALITGALIGASLVLAHRHRPIYAPTTPEQDNLDRYRELIDPFRKVAFVGVPILFGIFAGVAAQAQWKLPLLWLNRQPFGQKDPEFGLDIGFYVFTLPWLRFLVSFLTMALILSLVAALLTHYVYGGISLQGKGPRTTDAARIHLSLLLGGIVLIRALAYWLDRYDLTTGEGRLFTGIGYTDQHAVLPTKAILSLAAILCAALFVSTIWTKTWRLPLLGTALLVITAVLVGGIYPALVQNFSVRPSEQTKEAPFIKRNIDATRAAYGLSTTKTADYQPKTGITAGQLRADAATVPGIRTVDPTVVSPTFRQLQGRVNYYQFPDALDVDRYKIGGETRDTVIAARELDLSGVPAGQRNWVNDHTVYTHGFGLVASYGNKRTADGAPEFFECNIPPTGKCGEAGADRGGLGKYEPRIYFGESSPTYSIVGGTTGGPARELDYPDTGAAAAGSAGGEKRTTYKGNGGVPVDSFARKLAYATKYRQYNILLSDVVNDGSKLLDHRDPRDRVKRVAPWLTVDGNAYPVVVDGRIKWVIDGYTTSSRYPYSQLASIGDATSDSLTTRSENVRSIAGGQVNYIRNSVKATVDAYDGSVEMYAWDDKDPVLKAWQKIFGGTVKPISKIDGDLMSHLRYPEDMFKVQRELLAKYHVTDANAFYQGNDFWQVPKDPTQAGAATPTPPYYLSIAMPDQKTPAFSLTSSFIPTGDRQNLSGFMAVDADAGSENGKKKPGYGTIRLLEMPRASTIKGPGQFQNDIESSNDKSQAFEQTLSQFLSLNRQQNSVVQLGNLLTLPVGGGLLYVEPIYVQARGNTSYPLQRLVVTSFGNKLAWSSTLDGALDELFGGDSGASAGDAGTTPTPAPGAPTTPSPSPSAPPGGTTPPGTSTTPPPSATGTPLQRALNDVQTAFNDGQDALKKGDFTAYGQAQKRLQDAIQRAVKLQPGGGSVTVSPAPTSTPTATTTTK